MNYSKVTLIMKILCFFWVGTKGTPVLLKSGEPDLASPRIDFEFRNASIIDRCVIPGVVALTFGKNESAKNIGHTGKICIYFTRRWSIHPNLPEVLDVLADYNVTATFFINGGNYMDIAWPNASEITQRTIDEGHTIASHTHNHANLTDDRSREFIEFQMNHLSDEIVRLFGQRSWAMRPPFGEYNDTVVDIIGGELGYEIIMWTFSTSDWAHPCNTTASLERYVKRMNGTDPASTLGFIALHHDPIPCSDTLTAAVIEYAYSIGYRFVSLAECLGMPFI